MRKPQIVHLGLGANCAGRWGPPLATLRRATHEIETQTGRLLACSALYYSTAIGPGRQPKYLNAVLTICCSLPPQVLLRRIKKIERRAGRRLGRTWGPRPLDIDILDMGGRTLGKVQARRRRGELVLPHPEILHRAFVLVPLLDVAPNWRHPRARISARSALTRLRRTRRDVVPALDLPWQAWQEGRR